MSEYTLYIATVLLVAASILMSRLPIDTPDAEAADPVAAILPFSHDEP